MSNEAIQQSGGNKFIEYGMFPAIQLTGSGISAIKKHGGIRKAIKAQNNAGFNNLDATLKQNNLDVFTRSQSLAKGYEEYKTLAAEYSKACRIVKKGKLPIGVRIKNLFLKNKTGLDYYKKIAEGKAYKNANECINKLSPDNVKGLNKETFSNRIKNLDEAISAKDGQKNIFEKSLKTITPGENAFKKSVKGFGRNIKTNFRNELGLKHGKLNYFMTALSFIPNIINEVIPTFKEEGFKEGIKETGKTIVRMGADLVGYAAGGSIGRVIGTAAGAILCPFAKGTAARIGGMIGDTLFTMIIGGKFTEGIDKLLGVKNEEEKSANEIATQNTNEEALVSSNPEQNTSVASNTPNEVVKTPATTNPIESSNTSDLSLEQAKQLAYKQAFKQPQQGYFNNYLA